MKTPISSSVEVTQLDNSVTMPIERGNIIVKDTRKIETEDFHFGLFNDLPRELRLKIWRLTFKPQVITVRVESHGWISPSIRSSFPVTLRVCKESRQEALTWYHLCFREGPYPTYINPYIDIPHIRHGSKGCRAVMPVLPYPAFDFSSAFLRNLKVFFNDKCISALRHLAIDRDLWVLRMGSAPLLMRLFERLEQLTIIIDDDFLHDEREWVDDSDEEDMQDIDTQYDMYEDEGEIQIEVLEVWDDPNGENTSGQYHRRAENQEYVMERLKLRQSEWDYPHNFVESKCSTRYAAFVKEDVVEKLNDGSKLGILRKGPEVNVMIENLDRS
jgi:2EXR family